MSRHAVEKAGFFGFTSVNSRFQCARHVNNAIARIVDTTQRVLTSLARVMNRIIMILIDYVRPVVGHLRTLPGGSLYAHPL
jgi:hypothetical protein